MDVGLEVRGEAKTGKGSLGLFLFFIFSPSTFFLFFLGISAAHLTGGEGRRKQPGVYMVLIKSKYGDLYVKNNSLGTHVPRHQKTGD